MRSADFLIKLLATVAVGMSPFVGGCGESKEKSGGARAKRPGANELLRVSAREIQRVERPGNDEMVSGGAATSEVGVKSTGQPTAADSVAAKLAPKVSGWSSEHLSTLASAQLALLAKPVAEIDFSTLLADEFTTTPLVPTNLQERTLPGGLKIVEGTIATSPGQGLAQELGQLRARIGADATTRFKLVAIELKSGAGSEFTTDVLVEVVGRGSTGPASQIDTVWRCTWRGEAPARLTSLEVKSYREVRASGALFEDATRGVFENTPSFVRQMMHGVGYWAQRLTRVDDMHITGHYGIAVGDVNGDGLDDVYACDGGGLPNRLYVQAADGTVVDRSAAAGVDFLESSRSALLVDLDNDGDQDLAVATVALVIFLENDGTGTFELRGGHPGSPGPYSMAAGDYDNDGDLDVYVTSYGMGRDGSGAQGFEASSPIPYNDADNGGRNLLLANHGEFRFSDVTKSVGLDENNTRWTFAASWEDYDQDGDADLYVVNDFGRNNLYYNDGGVFRDIASKVGVEDMASGMSAAWGDANGDGKLDLYVGNMFSAAGNRVTYQSKFMALRRDGDTTGMQRMARGNSLFQQEPGGNFRDVSEEVGVTMGRWAWSSGFVDVNNDGREDLVVANGYLSNSNSDDL